MSFLVPAALLVSLPLILMWWVLQQRSRAARLSYATLVPLVIVGFGLQDGLWNHTVKMAVFFLRGADRAEMAGLPFPRLARCSMSSPVCSPLWQRFLQHISVTNSSPRPASCRPRRGISAGCGRDWFPGCDAQQWEAGGVAGGAAQHGGEVPDHGQPRRLL